MDQNKGMKESIEGEYEVLGEEVVREADTIDSFRKVTFDPHKILVTYVFLAANIVIWLIMSLFGLLFDLGVTHQLVLFGAKVNTLIAQGQIWRLLSAMFLHVNLIHLFFNSYALFIYGPIVEKIYGRSRFVAIYIVSGLIGTLFSYLFNPYPAAGASGAIFGLMGALLYLRQHRKDFFRRMFGPGLIMIIIINLMYGVTQPGIDNWGHMGGLAGGYIIGIGLGLYGEKLFAIRKILIWVAVIVAIFIGLMYGHGKYA
jgi:rhomboid protease GluP